MVVYSPSSLPEVSSVQVVVLNGINPENVDGFMHAANNRPVVTAGNETSIRIASLYRHLPPGEAARCHIPPFGLRFMVGTEVICQASICWRCNNIFGEANGLPFSYDFDADANVSQKLLSELQELTGSVDGT